MQTTYALMVMNTSGQNLAWVISKWTGYCSSTESMVDSWRNETPHSTSEITYETCAFITIDVNLPQPPLHNTFHVSLSKARSYFAIICHFRLRLHNGKMTQRFFPNELLLLVLDTSAFFFPTRIILPRTLTALFIK